MAKEHLSILIRGCVDPIINPVDLIYRFFYNFGSEKSESGVITNCVITFCVKKVFTFRVDNLLHFALMLLHCALVSHIAAVITFCGVTAVLKAGVNMNLSEI